MVPTLMLVVSVFAMPQPKPAALPDTPQGRHVQAWVTAFNTGDEKTFLAAQKRIMATSVLEKRSDAERAKLFQRMRGDFASLKIDKVLKATAAEIQIAVPAQDGGVGTFTFQFEPTPPHLITSIGIDVQG